MSLECRVKVEDDHLCAELTGPFDLESAKKRILELLETCLAHRLTKVLADCRGITGHISLITRFEVGEFLAEALPVPIQIAIIGSEEDAADDKFIETVADNRGVIIKVTTNPAEAMEWLDIEAAKGKRSNN